MKFGVKLVDQASINHFTHVVATVSRLCSKSANDKSCVLKMNPEEMYFILTEFASNGITNIGAGRTSFWLVCGLLFLFIFLLKFIVESTSFL